MKVRHSSGAYEVQICALKDALAMLPAENRTVTDENVYRIYGNALAGQNVYTAPAGETSKSLATFGSVLRWLATTKTSRKASVIALGGGVVGDLAGFVAASYMRGVGFVQIPTTLLAMVDSSVGGKVGIDLPEGKNLAGAFQPPDAVYIPIEVLQTLPPRQFTNGMAEVLKYGFIMDRRLSDRLAERVVTPAADDLTQIVLRCIELKAQVVEEDEFETNGRRAILNFGHTIGHAVEHAMGYGGLLHGEAISIGMAMEARLGERLGASPAGIADRIEHDLSQYGLPIRMESPVSADELLDTMARDKKAEPGNLSFSLLTDLGGCKLVRGVDSEMVREVLGKI